MIMRSSQRAQLDWHQNAMYAPIDDDGDCLRGLKTIGVAEPQT